MSVCGFPAGCYLKGFLVFHVKDAMKPKDLRIDPSEFHFDSEIKILERTLYLNWMRSWLEHLRWSHSLAMEEDPTQRSSTYSQLQW